MTTASRQLDKAASKGVIHPNQAANRKSAMAVRVNGLTPEDETAGAFGRCAVWSPFERSVPSRPPHRVERNRLSAACARWPAR